MSTQVYTDVITMVARMTSIKKRAVQASNFESLSPQDIFIGLLIENESPIVPQQENYQIIANDEFGEVIEVSPSGWLREDLKRQGAEVGDLIAITLLGNKPPYAEYNKNDYLLIIDKGRFKETIVAEIQRDSVLMRRPTSETKSQHQPSIRTKMMNNIINYPEIAEMKPDSAALILAKDAIDNLSDYETDDLFYYLIAMGYPLSD